MKTVTWSVANNLFLTAIRGSYINAQKMSNFYFAKLSANNSDPDIALLKANYQPFDTTMNSTYTAFLSQGGMQTGSSEGFSQRLAEITANANLWDSSAQLIYTKGSAPYLALFPNGHYPFLHGAQIDRINAIKALSLSLGLSAANDIVNAAALSTL